MRDLRLSAEQAARLEELNSSRPVKVIAVTGGKGGVGKTTVSANLAVSIAAAGGTSCWWMRIWASPMSTCCSGCIPGAISGTSSGQCALEDAIVTGPHGLQIVPAASGVKRMASLSQAEHAGLIRAFSDLYHRVEVMVVDTAAGLLRQRHDLYAGGPSCPGRGVR